MHEPETQVQKFTQRAEIVYDEEMQKAISQAISRKIIEYETQLGLESSVDKPVPKRLSFKEYIEVLADIIGEWWCINFHDPKDLTRPANGKYICLVCGREYECPYR